MLIKLWLVILPLGLLFNHNSLKQQTSIPPSLELIGDDQFRINHTETLRTQR